MMNGHKSGYYTWYDTVRYWHHIYLDAVKFVMQTNRIGCNSQIYDCRTGYIVWSKDSDGNSLSGPINIRGF